MIPLLQNALRRHCDQTPDLGTGLVWTREDGRPILDRSDTAAWRDTLVAAGIYAVNEEAPTLHVARHTLATVLQARNVPEPVRMAIMGHSSVAAHRGYAHVDQTLTRAALGELGKLLT
jgi:integrase